MKAASIAFNTFIVIFICVLILWFTQLNFDDLSFNENINAYFGIGSVALMIFAVLMIKKSINKKIIGSKSR